MGGWQSEPGHRPANLAYHPYPCCSGLSVRSRRGLLSSPAMRRMIGFGTVLLLLIACSGDPASDEIASQPEVPLQTRAVGTAVVGTTIAVGDAVAATVRATTEQTALAEDNPPQPDQGGNHIPLGTDFDAYNTRPATSGPHWGVIVPSPILPAGSPARWGQYEFELPDEVLVHNLEHGGIGLHYNCPSGCPEMVQQLIDLAPRGFSQFVISPYTAMDSKIAITAWRHVLYLDEFDEAQLREFIRSFQDQALESIPGNLF